MATFIIIILCLNFAFISRINCDSLSYSKQFIRFFENESKSEVSSFAENLLSELILKDDLNSNVLFILDKVSFDMNCINNILMKRTKRTSTVIVTSFEDFNTNDFSFNIIRGSFFSIYIIFYTDDILQFFQKISLDQRWAPQYLTVISLNPKTHLSSDLFQSHIQRSRYILICEIMEKFGSYYVSTYSIYPTVKNVNGKSVLKIRLDKWDNSKNLKNLYVDRLKSFHGNLMKTSSACFGTLDFPFLFTSENGTCVGSNVEVLEIIADRLNFKFSITYSSEDGKWGQFINGNWNGMMRDIITGRKNFAINTHIIIDELARDFDISYTYHLQNLAVVSMKPLPFPAWMKLIGPFPMRVWILTFVAVVIVNLTIVILFKISQKQPSYDGIYLALGITGLIFRQNIIRKSPLWIKLFLGIWALMVFILTAAYSSMLVSNLTYPKYPPLVKNFKEMAESDSKLCGFWSLLDTMGVLNSSNEYLRKIMSQNYIDLESPALYKDFSFDTLLEPVKARKCMYIVFESVTRICQTHYLTVVNSYVIDDKIFGFQVSFVLAKHSTLTHPINVLLSKLTESGIYQYLYNKYQQTNRTYFETSIYSRDFIPIRIIDLQTAFYALIGGYALAFASFVTEIFLNKRKEKKCIV